MDYYGSFSPVANMVTVRVFLALAVVRGLHVDNYSSIMYSFMDP